MLQALEKKVRGIKRAGCMIAAAAMLAGSVFQPVSAMENETVSGQQESVSLGIDNRHVYEGMDHSFSDGYRPSVNQDTFEIVIPFTVRGALKDNRITVDLRYPSDSGSPFEQKNYQKDVTAERYVFEEEEQETFLYQVKGTLKPDAEPGQYPLTVSAVGYGTDGEKTELECTVYINIEETASAGTEEAEEKKEEGTDTGGEEESNEKPEAAGSYGTAGGDTAGEKEEVIRQPKLLLESDQLPQTDLESGSRQDLNVMFRNCSKSEGIYNLKVTASMEAAGIRLTQNSWYFRFVGADETITLKQGVNVGWDVPEGDHGIIYTFEYEDEKGTAFTGTETLSISVSQPVRMALEMEEMPTVLFSTDTVEVPVKTLNLSRTTVYNVRLHLEGTGLFPTEDVFIGNMEAGTAGEGTMRVYVGTKTMNDARQELAENEEEKYGDVSGTITLFYEDASGEIYQETREYQTRIQKPQIVSLQVEEEKESNPWWISVITAVFVGMGVTIFMLTKLLRKKGIQLKEAEMQKWFRDHDPGREGL